MLTCGKGVSKKVDRDWRLTKAVIPSWEKIMIFTQYEWSAPMLNETLPVPFRDWCALGRQPRIYILICTCAYVCIDMYTYIYIYIYIFIHNVQCTCLCVPWCSLGGCRYETSGKMVGTIATVDFCSMKKFRKTFWIMQKGCWGWCSSKSWPLVFWINGAGVCVW